jgi:phosphatidate cytidylyltransferase
MGGIVKKKIWTSILIVPPIVVLIIVGPSAVLRLMVLLATYFGLREFYTLALPHSKPIDRLFGIGLGLILSALISFGSAGSISLFFVFLLLCLSVFFMATSQDLLPTISNLGITLFGILYVGLLLSHISLIRNMADGKEWALFLIATVWAGDISAFSVGSLLGKHKLYPKISPKKTFEGLIGGVIGSVIVALAFRQLFIPQLGMENCILIGVGLAVFGQLGDFTESMLKRSAQVKDSGSLIPGHGGMLDRLDSFLFSAPFLYYFLLYVIKERP